MSYIYQLLLLSSLSEFYKSIQDCYVNVIIMMGTFRAYCSALVAQRKTNQNAGLYGICISSGVKDVLLIKLLKVAYN